MIAALFVETGGCYHGLKGVEFWDIVRDAKKYKGPWPVVAHPPCQRWGRFWHGSTRKPHQFKLGDDGGCFKSALASVRKWGGVLEHPADSHAWKHFGLSAPPRSGGWVQADNVGGWTCYVEQGHYGHMARKGTWLYAAHIELPELRWGVGAQRIHPAALAKHGYEKARRIGMLAMVGGKHKTEIRNATPTEFRDVLLDMARAAKPKQKLTKAQRAKQRAKKKAEDSLLYLPRFSKYEGTGEWEYSIDPGLGGAICAKNGKRVEIWDMPVIGGGTNKFIDGLALALIFKHYPAKKITIEHVNSMPTDGHVGAFKFGGAYHVVVSFALAQKCHIKMIKPQAWKKRLGLLKTSKNASRALASKMRPDLAPMFRRVDDADRAEAFLLGVAN